MKTPDPALPNEPKTRATLPNVHRRRFVLAAAAAGTTLAMDRVPAAESNAPDTYLEGSASSMFLYGMAESRGRKLLRIPYADVMRRAWDGLVKTIGPDGRVGGVSEGTGPSGKAGYVGRKVGTHTWGTGAFLLAACTLAEFGT